MQLSAKQREFIDKLLALTKDYEREGLQVVFPIGLGREGVEIVIYVMPPASRQDCSLSL